MSQGYFCTQIVFVYQANKYPLTLAITLTISRWRYNTTNSNNKIYNIYLNNNNNVANDRY